MHDEFRKRTQEALELARSFGFQGTEQALVDILQAHERRFWAGGKDTISSELFAQVH